MVAREPAAEQEPAVLLVRLTACEHECHRSQRETARLKEQLADRDQQYNDLASQFNVLRRKYQYMKDQQTHIFWEYLPRHVPEFQTLDVHSRAGCSSVSFESDTRVNDIEVHNHIGTGRFGEVCAGVVSHSDGSETEIALKGISKTKVRSIVALRNLANEIACMRQLTSAKAAAEPDSEEASALSHVALLHSATISDSAVYIAQSNGGSDLFSLMTLCTQEKDCDQQARLPVVLVSAVAQGLMAAIAGVHHQGWCHRDIKPENILIGTDAERVLRAPSAEKAAAQIHVRLCDFGVCARLPHANAAPLTQFCGSPGFFAPELADATRGTPVAGASAARLAGRDGTNGESDDSGGDDDDSAGGALRVPKGAYDGAAVDVFSAGATLLELLLGRHRFARMWGVAYQDYAVRGARDLSRSIESARRAVAGALRVDGAAAATTAAPPECVMAENATSMSDAVGLPQLDALALACVHGDPRRRPASHTIVDATFRCAGASASAAGGALGGGTATPTKARSFRRRNHYSLADPELSTECNLDDSDGGDAPGLGGCGGLLSQPMLLPAAPVLAAAAPSDGNRGHAASMSGAIQPPTTQCGGGPLASASADGEIPPSVSPTGVVPLLGTCPPPFGGHLERSRSGDNMPTSFCNLTPEQRSHGTLPQLGARGADWNCRIAAHQ